MGSPVATAIRFWALAAARFEASMRQARVSVAMRLAARPRALLGPLAVDLLGPFGGVHEEVDPAFLDPREALGDRRLPDLAVDDEPQLADAHGRDEALVLGQYLDLAVVGHEGDRLGLPE